MTSNDKTSSIDGGKKVKVEGSAKMGKVTAPIDAPSLTIDYQHAKQLVMELNMHMAGATTKCSQCKKSARDVSWVLNPYELNAFENVRIELLCDNCWDNLAEEV